MKSNQPVYIESHRTGLLAQRIQTARQRMRTCTLCPRQCRVDRLKQRQAGTCLTLDRARVSSYQAHFGEEAPLVGQNGSGTIFFTHCNLLCNFCQNFDISHEGYGQAVTDHQLADMMLALQQAGCHNINFVTPSHVVPQILSALAEACQHGLNIPLVYNSGGYDSVETLQLLDRIFDIYMPDFKFWDPSVAELTCQAPDYPQIAQAALREMHRQVGDLEVDDQGIARRGLLVRHLVMPEGLAGTQQVMQFIHAEISPNTYVNIMPQYRPCGDLEFTPQLRRSVTRAEFKQALQMAKQAGITRLDDPRWGFRLL